MNETELAQLVIAHKTTLVHLTADTEDATLASVLPDDVIALVSKHRRLIGIHGNHQMVFGKLAYEVLVVEITIGIDQWLLIVSTLEHIEELME
jgi:hypothetical protein